MKKNGSLWVNLPKIPLIATLDYNDFKKIISTEISSQKQDLSQSQAETIYKSYISPEGVKAYIACLQEEQPRIDIKIPAEALTDQNFFMTLTWLGRRGTPTGRLNNIGAHRFQIFGGEIPNLADYDKIENFNNGQEYPVLIKRDLSQSFGFAASVDGQSVTASLPAKAESSKIRFDVAVSSEQTAYGDGLNSQHNPFCMSAKNNETFLVSTIKLIHKIDVPINGKAWVDFAGPPNEKHICATAHAELYPGKRRPGAAKIWSHIEVLRMTDPDKQP